MWLVWLALLLPLAQSAASAHALSHLRESASQRQDEGAAVEGACALCLMGAAVASGNAASNAAPAPLPFIADLQPVASPVRVAALAPLWAQPSRAPPSQPR